jgi:hypothetical protein
MAMALVADQAELQAYSTSFKLITTSGRHIIKLIEFNGKHIACLIYTPIVVKYLCFESLM